jgi:thioredoxin reductase (NADPH)
VICHDHYLIQESRSLRVALKGKIGIAGDIELWGKRKMAEQFDCIIVGAGPAGLTAALYMARFRRRVLVVHDGTARALRIPLTHNVPGYVDGIAGPKLIERMSRHAEEYGATIVTGKVAAIEPKGTGFALGLEDGRSLPTRTVILATGIWLNQVPLPHDTHEAAIEAGILRYCAVCDAYEHIGKNIGVIGCDDSGVAQALFLRRYSDQVTLIPRTFSELSEEDRSQLADAGVRLIEQAMVDLEATPGSMLVWLEASLDPLRFDVIYPALGTRPRTDLARDLGLEVDDGGCLPPSSPMQTSIPGVFAAGDIVSGLDQISVAIGHGAVAATKAHGWLREQDQ